MLSNAQGVQGLGQGLGKSLSKEKQDWRNWSPKRGEIFLVNLGDSNSLIDSELRGLRPAVIISNDMNNKFSPTIQIAPLTSSQCKVNIPVHIKVGIEDGLRTESLVCKEVN